MSGERAHKQQRSRGLRAARLIVGLIAVTAAAAVPAWSTQAAVTHERVPLKLIDQYPLNPRTQPTPAPPKAPVRAPPAAPIGSAAAHGASGGFSPVWLLLPAALLMLGAWLVRLRVAPAGGRREHQTGPAPARSRRRSHVSMRRSSAPVQAPATDVGSERRDVLPETEPPPPRPEPVEAAVGAGEADRRADDDLPAEERAEAEQRAEERAEAERVRRLSGVRRLRSVRRLSGGRRLRACGG